MGRAASKKEVHSLRGKSSGIMSGNYPWTIRGFTSENYDLVYHHAEKWRFTGILAYPKIPLKGVIRSTLNIPVQDTED